VVSGLARGIDTAAHRRGPAGRRTHARRPPRWRRHDLPARKPIARRRNHPAGRSHQ
jgi:hypothetical protein